ncbi:MAG: hypothetical protein GY821_12785 [Gammaproteobacteria bacterium]|nr:hypothetical protein [Gammaproteobacteria bacterium]
MKTLTKSNLTIASVNKKDNTHHQLLVTKDYTLAASRCLLYKVSRPETGIFPAIKGFDPKENSSFLIESKRALEIAKKIPNDPNPHLRQAAIEQDVTLQIARIATTNLEDASICTALMEKDDTYHYEESIKTMVPREPNIKIEINPALLEDVCKKAQEFLKQSGSECSVGDSVFLEITDDKTMIKISARNAETRQNFTALLMPIAQNQHLASYIVKKK